MLDPLRARLRGTRPSPRRNQLVFGLMLLCSATGFLGWVVAEYTGRWWLGLACYAMLYVPYWYYQRLPPAV